jgi:hypothetical protein
MATPRSLLLALERESGCPRAPGAYRIAASPGWNEPNTIEAMPPDSPTARELTHRLISQATPRGDEPGAAAVAARDACECVAVEFSRWVGSRGYDALMSRVLAEARHAYPALDDIHYQIRPEPGLTGVAESIERHGAVATARALSALLETILGLLTRLIGDDLVVTFVENSMKNGRRLDSERTPNPGERSAAP